MAWAVRQAAVWMYQGHLEDTLGLISAQYTQPIYQKGENHVSENYHRWKFGW